MRTSVIAAMLAANGVADLTYLGSAVSGVDGASFTFSSLDFGPPHPDRALIVTGSQRAASAVTLSSITIGGVTATVVVEGRNTSSALSSAHIAIALVPTGLTGSVVVTWSGTAVLQGISLYRVTKYRSLTPQVTNTATSGASPTTVACHLVGASPGFAIGACNSFANGTNRRHLSGSMIGCARRISFNIAAGTTPDSDIINLLRRDFDGTVEAGAATVNAIATAHWNYP